MNQALLPNIFLTDTMRMLLDVIKTWDIPLSKDWIERESNMWSAFNLRARCYAVVKCKVSGEEPSKLYCERCVMKVPGPWEVEVDHYLYTDAAVPYILYCEVCGYAIFKIHWEKCARCIKTFNSHRTAERVHLYPDGQLKLDSAPVAQDGLPIPNFLRITPEERAEPTIPEMPVKSTPQPTALEEMAAEESEKPSDVNHDKKKKRKRSKAQSS